MHSSIVFRSSAFHLHRRDIPSGSLPITFQIQIQIQIQMPNYLGFLAQIYFAHLTVYASSWIGYCNYLSKRQDAKRQIACVNHRQKVEFFHPKLTAIRTLIYRLKGRRSRSPSRILVMYIPSCSRRVLGGREVEPRLTTASYDYNRFYCRFCFAILLLIHQKRCNK